MEDSGATDVLAALLGITAFAVLFILPIVVTALKGKIGMLALGVFIHLIWWFGAIRLAKPNSYRARRFYDGDKLQRAHDRFPDSVVSAPPPGNHDTRAAPHSQAAASSATPHPALTHAMHQTWLDFATSEPLADHQRRGDIGEHPRGRVVDPGHRRQRGGSRRGARLI
ncbi:hypothetical protein [Nocardia sp. NPDC052112]|uniref:hypothetical protein n=1 Tax=Nocardia sp. NPDC052112 TaxID=3155646 RepID=UPI0034369444